MARSYRTLPSVVSAKRNFPKTKSGLYIGPHIVERKPYPGDIFPLGKKHLRAFIRRFPMDYSYGLFSIELHPRQPPVIGHPFGMYMNDEKRIILYSCPWPKWTFKSLSLSSGNWYEEHGATLKKYRDRVDVLWPEKIDVAYFMYKEVLLHELGHHFHNQYRTKNKHPKTTAAEESSANRHARVLSNREIFYLWHQIQ